MHRHHRLLAIALFAVPAATAGCAQLASPDDQASSPQFSFIDFLPDQVDGTVAVGSTVGLSNDFAATCAPTGAPDATYLFTPPTTSTFVFDTFGSSFDTVLEIRDAATLISLGCNDDTPSGPQSSVRVTLPANRAVSVIIDGFGTSSGSYRLNLSRSRPTIPTSGLHLWLKADAGVVSSGSAVSRWLDQSGNGRNASMPVASRQPALVPNALGGLPVLQFSGAQSMTLDVPAQPTRFSVFVVGKNDAPRGTFSMILGPSGSGANNQMRWSEDGRQVMFIGQGNNLPMIMTPIGDTHVYHELSAVYDGSTMTVYRNGSLVSSSSVTVNGPWTLSSIGSFFSSFFMLGELAELIMYDGPLSGADRTTVDAYLQSRYPLQ